MGLGVQHQNPHAEFRSFVMDRFHCTGWQGQSTHFSQNFKRSPCLSQNFNRNATRYVALYPV